jgi:SAM-dependent methyltransferase
MYDADYYERGVLSGKSLYENYRWMPELTIPLAHHFIELLNIKKTDRVLDFGCAKGYLVKSLCLLGIDAYGYDVSSYALSTAPAEIRDRLSNEFNTPDRYAYIIAKDVLEHVAEEELTSLLEKFYISGKNLCVVVPLSDDGVEYNIKANERDLTHVIRKPLDWWEHKIEEAGFLMEKVTHNVGVFKQGQESIHPRGNGLLKGYKPI